PAQFGDARRLLALHPEQSDAKENERVVREGVASIRRLLHGTRSPKHRRSIMSFDVGFLNIAGGIAPQKIAIALDRTGRGSLCFYGPPGTGKTEFAHVLADALDRELVVKRSSDLISKYVGETEQNIAKLFNTIDAERSILFIDEVDSFLRDRRAAEHSWEITAVNELLQHMENYPGIIIAATNLMTGIDAAALRRFDFKLAFQPLTLPQRVALFAREALGDIEAGVSLPSPIVNRLGQLAKLTPGDFANVCRQRDIMGDDLAPEEFLRRLVQECRWKEAA
ncbi:MAG: ATP-binding protein, partial [Rugosibacter sp.]|nr:ATP-binding protein [Rugosibacter sp.]